MKNLLQPFVFVENNGFDALALAAEKGDESLLNISPSDLIRKIKIQVACRMLQEKNFTISEIAYDLGFCEPKYFSAIFKKEIGIKPTEYIKKHVLD